MKLTDKLNEAMQAAMQRKLGLISEQFDINTDKEALGTYLDVQAAVAQCAGEFTYEYGLFSVDFRHWQSVVDFCDILDEIPGVITYELLAFHKGDSKERVELDPEDIIDDSLYCFTVLVYLDEEDIIYYTDDELFDINDDGSMNSIEDLDDIDLSGLSAEELEQLDEVRRRIKVTSRGEKRVKMQCKPGFKWDGNACIKISGAELATSRKSHRRAILTKKAQGSALKVRVIRKTKKAKRFRKAMGL